MPVAIPTLTTTPIDVPRGRSNRPRIVQTARREPVPSRLGRYDVRAKIGEGGMATVYIGRVSDATAEDYGHPGDRVVALKVIKDEFALNADFVNMFLDEAKIVSRLHHPNVVQVFELGNEGARLFIAMELLFGQSLWHMWNACREKGVRLRYDLAAWIGARSADGLHHAHELKDESNASQNLVHRDVNASNIFVTYDGQVKIIDFGLAKAANRVSKTAVGVVKGKLAYMSPEQAVGKPLDRRTDVFALATTLWEVTVDRRLFKAQDDIETLKRVYAADVPDPTKLVPGYPPELWKVLQRALARDPENRYADASQFARDLDLASRCEGRTIVPQDVTDVMNALFAAERDRHAMWIAAASAREQPAPKETLRPAAPDPASSSALPFALTPIPPSVAEVAPVETSKLFAPSVPSLPEDISPSDPAMPMKFSSAPPAGVAPLAPPNKKAAIAAMILFALAIAIVLGGVIAWLTRR
jgi:serine/threonine protein kinase